MPQSFKNHTVDTVPRPRCTGLIKQSLENGVLNTNKILALLTGYRHIFAVKMEQ